MPYIDVIEPEQAEGELKNIYEELIQKRGKLAEVHKIQSLNPQSIVDHMDLYMTIMFGRSPLKRYQREMVAVVVSAANECRYCQKHHAAALQSFWKDEAKVDQLRADFRLIDLPEKDRLLCEYGWHLTKNPDSDEIPQIVDSLKQHSFNDRAILDTCLIISYFNFVNRMVLGLGVQLEEDEGEGYKYT